MGLAQTFIRILVLVSATILVVLITDSMSFADEESSAAPETSDMAKEILIDWSVPLLILGCILAMAMIGASYLIRDERETNLEYEMGWTEGET
ncbi:MAG: hypothetical protein CMB77_07875 [Euryarchaeota archaeon]|nr:hypothetical protein [Euryarchaeota archaeon]|tara:strand:- start:738 stop:1016 length:279 start_codon:yes stop_codon:yes gene_type:complete